MIDTDQYAGKVYEESIALRMDYVVNLIVECYNFIRGLKFIFFRDGSAEWLRASKNLV